MSLNHGSFGACPTPILKVQAEFRCEMEAEPVQFLGRRLEERLEPSRAALAKFIGARSRDLVFVTKATTGVARQRAVASAPLLPARTAARFDLEKTGP